MKPVLATFRRLLVALTAVAVLASPVAAHGVAGCNNDGVKVAVHHSKCCCGTHCHCTACPGANSRKHTPAPTPSGPDDARVLVKAPTLSSSAAVDVAYAPANSIGRDLLLLESANACHSLVAQHTCLRV